MPQSETVRTAYEKSLGPHVEASLATLRSQLPDQQSVDTRLAEIAAEAEANAKKEGAPAFAGADIHPAVESLDVTHQFTLMQGNADFLESALEQAWPDHPLFASGAGVYVAAHPTGELNARIEPLAGGYLVLVNVGSMMFCHLVSKILVSATQFTRYDENGELELDPAAGLPTHTQEELHAAILDVFASYVVDGDASRAVRFDALGGVRRRLHEMMRQFMEFFIVAHEFGHAVGGHLVRSMVPGDELEADTLAWDALERLYGLDSHAGIKVIAVAAVVVFFTSERILLDLEMAGSSEISGHQSTHPAPDERIANLVSANKWTEDDLGAALPSVNWLLEGVPAIREAIRRRQNLTITSDL